MTPDNSVTLEKSSANNAPTPTPWRTLRGLLLAGVLLRGLCVAVLTRMRYFYPDEESYQEIGRQILAGKGYIMGHWAFEGLIRPDEPTTYWGCLTPLLSALMQLLAGQHWLLIRLTLGEISFVATFLLLLAYARDFLNRRELILMSALLALYPNLHFLGSFLLTETLFLPLTLAALVLLRRLQIRLQFTDAAALGACFALAHLTRPVLLPFELAILGGLWWRHSWSRRWLALSATCVLTTALVMSPWLLRNYRLYGRVVVETKSGFGLLLHNNPLMYKHLSAGFDVRDLKNVEMPDFAGLNEAERGQRCQERFMAYLRNSPGQYAYLCWKRFVMLWPVQPRYVDGVAKYGFALSALNVGFYLCTAVGLSICLRRSIMTEGVWLVIYIVLLCTATISAARYRAPADPILLALAATSLSGLGAAVWPNSSDQPKRI
jgi:hypothetical protein